MQMIKELRAILMNQYPWKGNVLSEEGEVISSGFDALDALLPDGGSKRAGLIEIHIPYEGAGELALIMPALAQSSAENRKVVFVAPPYLPYAPSLAQAGIDRARYLLVKVQSLESRVWAVEQALRSGASTAVVFWTHGMDPYHLHRLQRAALEGQAIGFAFNHQTPEALPFSRLALRLSIRPARGAHIQVAILDQPESGDPVSVTLALPRNNPVLCTPLPPTRGRVASIPAWRGKQFALQNKSVKNIVNQTWYPEGNVA